MAVPDPSPGLVIRYAYLWRAEADRGREDGSKDRPCAVVLAIQRPDETIVVWAAPITHTPPPEGSGAVEIPAVTKKRLGLDDERSWIITIEVNSFRWPGPDIRPVPSRRAGEEPRFDYGYLGPNLTTAVIEGVREHRRQRRSKIVGREGVDTAGRG